MGRMPRHARLRVREVLCANCGVPGGIRGMQPFRRTVKDGIVKYYHDNTQGGLGCDWVFEGRRTLGGLIRRAAAKVKKALSPLSGPSEGE